MKGKKKKKNLELCWLSDNRITRNKNKDKLRDYSYRTHCSSCHGCEKTQNTWKWQRNSYSTGTHMPNLFHEKQFHQGYRMVILMTWKNRFLFFLPVAVQESKSRQACQQWREWARPAKSWYDAQNKIVQQPKDLKKPCKNRNKTGSHFHEESSTSYY